MAERCSHLSLCGGQAALSWLAFRMVRLGSRTTCDLLLVSGVEYSWFMSVVSLGKALYHNYLTGLRCKKSTRPLTALSLSEKNVLAPHRLLVSSYVLIVAVGLGHHVKRFEHSWESAI